MSAETVPEWLLTPPGGWTADDLDRLPPEAPRCEVLDGALYVMSPHTYFHSGAIWRLAAAFDNAVPPQWQVAIEVTIQLGKGDCPEPDVLVGYPEAALYPERTWYRPEEVALVVEVVSPESVHRDRVVKPQKYAEAHIPHFWRVEHHKGVPVVHVFSLDKSGRRYTEVAVERRKLEVEQPFPFSLDVNRLYP